MSTRGHRVHYSDLRDNLHFKMLFSRRKLQDGRANKERKLFAYCGILYRLVPFCQLAHIKAPFGGRNSSQYGDCVIFFIWLNCSPLLSEPFVWPLSSHNRNQFAATLRKIRLPQQQPDKALSKDPVVSCILPSSLCGTTRVCFTCLQPV